MWYPPLRRALLCLSKLYRSVDRSTFQGLSQVCNLSVKSYQIASTRKIIMTSQFEVSFDSTRPSEIDYATMNDRFTELK